MSRNLTTAEPSEPPRHPIMWTGGPRMIAVLLDHIEAGVPHSAQGCPVALALQGSLRMPALVGRVQAARGPAMAFATIFRRPVRLPPEVLGFIEEFDAGGLPLPFSFTAVLPEPWPSAIEEEPFTLTIPASLRAGPEAPDG